MIIPYDEMSDTQAIGANPAVGILQPRLAIFSHLLQHCFFEHFFRHTAGIELPSTSGGDTTSRFALRSIEITQVTFLLHVL